MTKHRYIGLATFLLAAIFLVVGYTVSSAPDASRPLATTKAQPSTAVPEAAATGDTSPAASARLTERLAVRFLEDYGETIDQPATQARLFNERLQLLRDYPDRGERLFEGALALAFPELKDQILNLMAKLLLFNEWLDDQELRLQGLAVLQRQAEIWRKREEIFGTLANDIWADEQSALEEKSEAFQQALTRLNEAKHMPLQEVAYQLQSTVDNLYGNDLATQMIGTGSLGRTLFSMQSVQEQLKSLPNEERQAQINELRRQLGYPESAVESLAKRDQEREQEWQQGASYMAERQQLQQSLSGSELDNAMQLLRQEYFGSSAPTIAREEEEEFFRFERRRRYGVN